MSKTLNSSVSCPTSNPKSRLEAVLHAGILQGSTSTHPSNAAKGGTERANAAAKALDLMELDDDLLRQILNEVASNDKPCESLLAFCATNKLVCDDQLYDKINQRFKWYGDYDNLNNLIQAASLVTMPITGVTLLKKLKDTMNDARSDAGLQVLNSQLSLSAKQWFVYSCRFFNNINRLLGDWQDISSNPQAYLNLHPAFHTLKRQYVAKYLRGKINVLKTRLNDLVDAAQQYPDEFIFKLQPLIEAAIKKLKEMVDILGDDQETEGKLKEMIDILGDDQEMSKQFIDIRDNVWHPLLIVLSDERKTPSSVTSYAYTFQLVMSGSHSVRSILFHLLTLPSLGNKYGYSFPNAAYGSDNPASYYGSFVLIDELD